MHEDGSAATVMLGLAGFNLIAVVPEYVGELEQAIETTIDTTVLAMPNGYLATAPMSAMSRKTHRQRSVDR